MLIEKAKQIRVHIIRMLAEAGSGHPGGSLSSTDIVSALFFHKMKHNPEDPEWDDRDRFILSKGHAAPVLYAALAESGYFPVRYLETLRKLGSSLQGHPDKLTLPGVEMSTGSLGQGLSISVGMALGFKMDNKDSRVYTLMGDGETQEGMVWEAAMAAAHYKTDNLTAIIDRNTLQIDGPTEEVMGLKDVAAKWKAFGWNVLVIDGHNMTEITAALDKAAETKGVPTMIVANTIKGKGVSFMEGKVKYHGVAPTAEEKKIALDELG
ncbi:transketolase [Candidatus Margulisiibacteriota bacterium]